MDNLLRVLAQRPLRKEDGYARLHDPHTSPVTTEMMDTAKKFCNSLDLMGELAQTWVLVLIDQIENPTQHAQLRHERI